MKTARALSLLTCLIAGPAQAFITVPYEEIAEFFDATAGHYRLHDFSSPIPATWNRTGFSFLASGPSQPLSLQQPVSKFRAPSSGAEVFTANPVEIAILSAPGSGWAPISSGAFRIPVPQAGGVCAAGLSPVYRYTVGTPTGSRHRYVVTQAQRSRMAALGWVDEGVTFCAHGVRDEPLAERFLEAGSPRPEGQCNGACVAARNVRLPSFSANSDSYFPDLFARTGLHAQTAWGLTPGIPSNRTFLQLAARFQPNTSRMRSAYGIYLDGTDRLSGQLASLSPTFTFDLGARETPTSGMFVPFRAGYDTDVELRIAFQAFVRSVTAAPPNSHAYALPVVEFRDATTDLRILFSVQAFGTVPPGDGIAREEGTGKVMVSTTFRTAPALGRSLGLDFLATPAPFVSTHPWGHGGDFDFRLTRADFVTLLGFARTIEPRLSVDPQHYQVASFQFRVETFGDAAIGVNVSAARLELLRR